MDSTPAPLHEDAADATVVIDGRTVRNLSAEEYAATYTGDLHPCPDVAASPLRKLVRRITAALRSSGGDGLPLAWMPAYSTGGAFPAGRPLGVVIHSTEGNNLPGSAEGLMGPNWFGGSKAGTSIHKCVDQDSIVEGVRRNVIAWHAGPGANGYYIGYEFCGKATWTAEEWRRPENIAMINNAAPFIAADLAYCQAPARWLSVVQVARRERGLLTHNDVKLAVGGTTHWDPGPNFPYAELLAAINGSPAVPGPAPAPAPAPVLDASTGWPSWVPAGHFFGLLSGPAASHGGANATERAYVKLIQQRLQALGFAPAGAGWADGVFEQATKDAVAAFQRARMPGTTRFGEVWADDWRVLVNGKGAPAPAPVRPAGPPALPGWSLPTGHRYGPRSNRSAKVHGGINAAERAVVKVIQQRLIAKGYVPGVSDWRSGWADGVWERATTDAMTRFQRAELPRTTIFGECWSDDYRRLAR